MRSAVAIAVTVLLAVAAVAAAQGVSTAVEPGMEYRIAVPVDGRDVVARSVAQVPLTFIVPLGLSGQHNIKVLGGGGGTIATEDGYSFAKFGIGYAYTPPQARNILLSGILILDLTFPSEGFAEALGFESREAWFNVGGEFSFDFVAVDLPVSFVVGASWGFQDKPSQVDVGLRIPLQSATLAERLH